jgi:hypothetical protein
MFIPKLMLNLCIDKKGNPTADAFMTRWMRQPTTQQNGAKKSVPQVLSDPVAPPVKATISNN